MVVLLDCTKFNHDAKGSSKLRSVSICLAFRIEELSTFNPVLHRSTKSRGDYYQYYRKTIDLFKQQFDQLHANDKYG